jgi:hypothetical protein
MPVSPATHAAVEPTIRTAPVDELTQALTIVDTGAAKAAVPAKSNKTDIPRYFRDDIETSGKRLGVGTLGRGETN